MSVGLPARSAIALVVRRHVDFKRVCSCCCPA
jgi:hypothetical protein